VGRTLAKLPLDPRVGRMILEAKDRQALDEVLVIASALSVQDVRDRPMDKQAQADQAHAKFDDEKSEFVGYLRLWKWLGDARGGHDAVHKLTNRQYETLLRENFINIRRVREWRDIHSQLHAVVGEQGWAAAPGRPKPGPAPSGGSDDAKRGAWGPHPLNDKPASYEQLHLSMLCGLLGNIGCKSEDEDWYLGARGIKFYRHPGAKLSKKPGRWIVAAELVETTRLFGRGIANIEPLWIEQVAGHLLNKQLLDPHWEKKAAQVTALERATLYGLVVYNGRRVNFGRVDPVTAREIFIREALVAGNWDTKLPFLAANQKLIEQVQDLEHKARRQDVLVDEELIYAFYDQQLPAEICTGASCERWYKDEVKKQPNLLQLTRDELMRHEAAGITTESFPKNLRLGGVDCMATYLHEPGDAKDGVTVDVPLFALNQVNEERCEWLVPGMLKDKVQALIKTLHQRPRSRLVPLPDTAARMAEQLNQPQLFGSGSLTDAVLKWVRDATSLDIKRADLKLDMLPAHLFMNFRVVDEHGRQLGTGRNLGALKGELGSQARGAFQALAGLKNLAIGPGADTPQNTEVVQNSASNKAPAKSGRAQAAPENIAIKVPERYTSWRFGELPELMEIGRGGQTLIGFPALIDLDDAVTIAVFDEPEVAAARHRAGLRRLFSLQIKDALKYLEKNLPDLQKTATAYMLVGRAADNSGGGTVDELRQLIIEVALDRAFLLEPLPTNEADFKKRVDDGRGRLTLIASEVARLAAAILTEFAVAQRKIKDTKNAAEAALDAAQQLQRLVPKKFLTATPYGQLQHFTRYLKAITLRLEKWRADPARDAARLAELRPQEQRYWRLVADRKGAVDARMQEYRWLLEELRVSFFAQELRTPQPVSIKRLDKLWTQLNG
jgi:ATP-dependent helicase HrpA